MSYPQEPLQKFLDELAARTPTPGGGSASALGGAIGIALAHMAGAFTAGNEKFAAVEAQVTALQQEFDVLRHQFTELMAEDIQAYAAYSAARSLPKGSAAEKQKRSAAIAAANEQATVVPERIVVAAVAGLEWVEKLSAVANPRLAGDVAVAAYFLEAAARGAGIQVLSNCAGADTDSVQAARRTAVTEKIARCQAARERIHQTVVRLLQTT